MALRFTRKHSAITAGAAGLMLALAACGGSSGGGAAASQPAGCEDYAQYGYYPDSEVSIYSSIREKESDDINASFEEFTKCTGIKVTHEGSGEFEATLTVRVEGGQAPDIALFPQPGLFADYASSDKLTQPSDDYITAAQANYSESWMNYGTVDGQVWGAPYKANVKSFVWYSPTMFADNGWAIPTTWAEMTALSDKIAAEGKMKPWCVGFESGGATGWVGTDWIEDIMLRSAGAEKYDQWVDHTLAFDSPEVRAAFDEAGKYLKNPDYVNGGFGGVDSIPSTAFQDGGLPILKDKCAMHRQASFYAANWPEGTTVAEDGDVFAFYLPPFDAAAGKPVLGGGEIVGQFNDDEETQMTALYMTSVEYNNNFLSYCDCVVANKNVDVSLIDNPINALSTEILADPDAVFRFDGSDLMPGPVGTGSFWTGMVEWVLGNKTTDEVTTDIQTSWPS